MDIVMTNVANIKKRQKDESAMFNIGIEWKWWDVRKWISYFHIQETSSYFNFLCRNAVFKNL